MGDSTVLERGTRRLAKVCSEICIGSRRFGRGWVSSDPTVRTASGTTQAANSRTVPLC